MKKYMGYLKIFLTGFFMGSADLIPGVSGGTIAFLAGIYEELLQSIKTITGTVIKHALKLQIRDAWNATPFTFVVPLGLGMITALLSLSQAVSYLLKNQPVYIWSFFFGLVLASVVVVSKRIQRWLGSHYGAFVLSALLSYIIVGSLPVETPARPLYFFLSGVIAICAMILPGISGSFILLLLGKYAQVLDAVNNREIFTLGLVAAGCFVGIAVFSRILSWLLAKHHDITIALLAGFMFGSLRKIWPYREVILTRINSHGEIVPVAEKLMLPSGSAWSLTFSLFLTIAGIVVIFFLSRAQLTREEHIEE